MRMHEDQFDLSADAVRTVVRHQMPQWQSEEVLAVTSQGTVNALYRLGADVVLRFPLRPSSAPALRASLIEEQQAARRVAPVTRLGVPTPLALGEPQPEYPGWWTAYSWLPGQTVSMHVLSDPHQFAADLASFVTTLQEIPSEGRGWDGQSRGGPLLSLREEVSTALALSSSLVDVDSLNAVWQRCLAIDADADAAQPVWIHADLMPGNLLMRDGELSAVIDYGSMCIGDPAVDLMPAWNLFSSQARTTYRAALGADDAMWERGRGWAIAQAINALPYYLDTNRAMVDIARRTLAAVLE